MKREQMEHILRAAGAITNQQVFVVVGSQALLASHPDMRPPLDASMELDIYPLETPEDAALIEGSIGELSPFDETFGYYAYAISPGTALLPSGWRGRAIVVENENTGGTQGICISAVDLAISKLAAGRDKDLSFVAAMFDQHILGKTDFEAVLAELDEAVQHSIRQRLASMRTCP
jgi:hypothetical protein